MKTVNTNRFDTKQTSYTISSLCVLVKAFIVFGCALTPFTNHFPPKYYFCAVLFHRSLFARLSSNLSITQSDSSFTTLRVSLAYMDHSNKHAACGSAAISRPLSIPELSSITSLIPLLNG